ncbi:MAG: PTS sugar transporter subunit IIA [Syntrophales bacterium]|nr:PTS sugar transporter subunit IIA [Syntrophales bacterium]MCK9528339.1 PTS sugar transporter subunit IIA [Syntrophales bacterium]MDX9922178.1 PTS sugar transporter subunit IIA [Syntrophales bacterium]
MIGVIVITHGNLGRELIRAAELIKGEMKGVLPVSVDATKSVEDLKKEITTVLKKADSGEGVLILTDLFGGTPSNISLSFLKKNKIEVVTGVNLPMLLKVPTLRMEMKLAEFADSIAEYGRKNIYLAGAILDRKADD